MIRREEVNGDVSGLERKKQEVTQRDSDNHYISHHFSLICIYLPLKGKGFQPGAYFGLAFTCVIMLGKKISEIRPILRENYYAGQLLNSCNVI